MTSTRHIFAVTILVACLLNVVLSDDDDDDYHEDLECDHDTCYQPIVQGNCEAYIPRYAFNQRLGQCVRFIYGGCQGNSNNFRTLRECLQTCEGCDQIVGDMTCSRPADSGPCNGYFPRYWYNSDRRRCEKFIYGGCGGNKNNWSTKSECQSQCQG